MSQHYRLGMGLVLALMAGWPSAATAEPSRPQSAPAQPAQPMPKILPAAVATDAFKPQDSAESEPAFGPESLARTQGGLRFYEDIVAQGGWKKLPDGARGLKQGMDSAHVGMLKARLAVSGDLDNANAASSQYDAATTAAVKRFQARHGLSETGSIGKLTFAALNVPADVRLKQLKASVERLNNNVFKFAPRYVVVNIPGAVVEAVANGKVERRHLAVVGKKERQSPVISARISSVNLNPHWTVPNSIIRNDIVKALRKDPLHLNKNNLRTVNWKGEEVDPNTVEWTSKKDPQFLLRQDPGPQNSLGQLKIDMPNAEAVYLHDTPKKELFKQDIRFHSSGCARVSDVRDLAAWLLADQGVDRASIDRDIDAGLRTEIKLKKHVPVAWVYLTAYADSQGRVQFREDIYGLDTPEGIALTTLDGKKKIRPVKPENMPLASRVKPAKAQQQLAGRPVADPVTTGSVTPRKTVSGKPSPGKAASAKPVANKPVASKPVPPAAIPNAPIPVASVAKTRQ
ncbi:MAG: L,D-transpeptidase family protein [Beijerinckiaceae bacterium]